MCDRKLKHLIDPKSPFQYQSTSIGSVLPVVFLNQGSTKFICFWKFSPHFLGQHLQKPSLTPIQIAEDTVKTILITSRITGNPGFPGQHASSWLISQTLTSFGFCRDLITQAFCSLEPFQVDIHGLRHQSLSQGRPPRCSLHLLALRENLSLPGSLMPLQPS